jgi:hypothetical protein
MRSTGHLEFEDYPTGIVFGFFEQLLSVCRESRVHSNKVVMFFDSRKSHRRRAFPDYKQAREDLTDDEVAMRTVLRGEVTLLRTEFLPQIGFPCRLQTGLESDDLLAQAARQLDPLAGPGEPGVIITADGDLFQAINEQVAWYDPARGLYYEPLSFYGEKGIAPELWGEVKCLAGCTSDGVPGIPGVGEKTAIKYINGTLPGHYKASKAIRSQEGAVTAGINTGLVKLPHIKTRPVDLTPPEYNPEAFFDVCTAYGIESYLNGDKRKAWEAFFEGRLGGQSKPRRRGEKR